MERHKNGEERKKYRWKDIKIGNKEINTDGMTQKYRKERIKNRWKDKKHRKKGGKGKRKEKQMKRPKNIERKENLKQKKGRKTDGQT